MHPSVGTSVTQLLKKTRHGLYEKIQERREQTQITHKSVSGTGWQEVFIAECSWSK